MGTSMNATAVPLLIKAIDDADISTLKHALKSMCEASTECSNSAAKFFLIPKGQAAMDDEEDCDDKEKEEVDDEEEVDNDKEEEESGDEEEEVEDDDKKSEHKDEDEEAKESHCAKQKKLNHDSTGVDTELISQYETCAVCRKQFDLTLNDQKACQVHKEDLEIDADNVVGDEDEYTYALEGVNPEDFPDQFKWTCCDRNARAKPCHVSRHVVKRPMATRAARQFPAGITLHRRTGGR